MYETLALLQELGGLESDVAGSVLERAAAVARVQEAAEARETEVKQAQAAERAEQLAIVNRSLGDPLGRLQSERALAVDLGDEVSDLETRLAKAKAKLAACQDRQRAMADDLLVLGESSSRSRPLNPLEQATMRAQDELRRAHESRIVLERARRAVRHGR